VTGLVFTLSEVTQRIKAKELLRKSEEQYRTLFEKSINAIFLVDGKTGQYLNANKAAEELTGRSVESLKKLTTRDVSKTGSDGRLLRIKRIVDNIDFGVVVYHRPDGSKRNALLSAVGIDENLVFGIAMDITERVQKEVALLKSEERYRVFINSTEDLVFLKDEHLKYIIVNKANAAFFNKSEIEILGKTDFELMSEEAAHNCYSTDKLALSSDMVIIQKEKVGDKVYESRKFKILLENASYGVGGYIRDITKEVEAQIALQKSEHLFNTLATISPVGIFHAGIDGRTTYVNPALCQMAGISEETAIGNGWFSAIHPDDTELVVAEMKASIQNQSGSRFEYRFLRPDGSIVNFIGNAVPEFDSNKHLVGFVGTLTDITELKRMEGNLIEAKEKAEESDRLKTAFLHNISHEIRTPMNALIGFSALLGEPGLTHDDQILFINTMQQSGDHLLSIITDIFNISNIEANIVKINVNETNLNLTLKKVYDQFLPKADEKKISFHFETTLAVEKSIIQTDPTKLVEILSNLISMHLNSQNKERLLSVIS
jgi:PAS domain S-box-containing protein